MDKKEFREIINKYVKSMDYIYDEYGDYLGLGEIIGIAGDYSIVPKELWDNEEFCLMWLQETANHGMGMDTNRISPRLLSDKNFIGKAFITVPSERKPLMYKTNLKDDSEFIEEIESKILKGYQGIFFDKETQKKLVQLQENGLSDIVNDMHITFNFGELDKYPDELMNKEIALKLIGYASDGKNSGFQVELPEELKSYYKNKNGAHITVSLGEVDGVKGRAVDTGTMNFEEIDPVEISGKLGYFVFREDRSKSGKVMDNSLFEENIKEISKHSAKEVSEGISPREGEIEEVLDETIVEQDRVNNPEQEKKGQTQGDD